jgi:hypothetical protein
VTDSPLAPALDRIKQEAAEEATRAVSRFWWAEAQKISEVTTDPEARWNLLMTALRRVGWTA